MLFLLHTSRTVRFFYIVLVTENTPYNETYNVNFPQITFLKIKYIVL